MISLYWSKFVDAPTSISRSGKNIFQTYFALECCQSRTNSCFTVLKTFHSTQTLYFTTLESLNQNSIVELKRALLFFQLSETWRENKQKNRKAATHCIHYFIEKIICQQKLWYQGFQIKVDFTETNEFTLTDHLHQPHPAPFWTYSAISFGGLKDQ